MVRAILEGRMTQTRRVIKPQPQGETVAWGCGTASKGFGFRFGESQKRINCPYGNVGDHLWVRETWRIGAWREDDGKVAVDYRASPEMVQTPWIFLEEEIYRTTEGRVIRELEYLGIQPDEDGYFDWDYGKAPLSWRPSIHMPRWASRITLEITGIRVLVQGPSCMV
jgi:hypothetical protein